ncbi:MAG: protease SohB [Gammaproteobacteria bacterium RIFCSPHIGHO2_12_FULL_35_23]|nr:MAG: protease SohB [Gammaproteobacteria bacterium RIFCSPHIGHO2_12_FULL_35_23]
MIDALIHILVFLVEAVILVAAILTVISGLFTIASKNRSKTSGKIRVKKINEHIANLSQTIKETVLTKSERKKLIKKKKKANLKHKKTIFILDFYGDIRAKAVSSLREEITAIVMSADPGDEVLLRIESPGGIMSNYGLAASQVNRLRNANIPLTVAIDKVAASGGYLMACVANKIIAAPFAIIGSIGVVTQLPNFHRLLKNNHIDFEQVTAGDYKRTITLFAENTDSDRQKAQEDVNEAHVLFKNFVSEHRPILDIQRVATGECWFATQAKDLLLVDELSTSDDFLLQNYKFANLVHVSFQEPKKFHQKFAALAQAAYEKLYYALWNKQHNSKLDL